MTRKFRQIKDSSRKDARQKKLVFRFVTKKDKKNYYNLYFAFFRRRKILKVCRENGKILKLKPIIFAKF